MSKLRLNAHTIESRLREHTKGGDFCTYEDIQKTLGISYQQARNLIFPTLEPVTKTRPRKFYTPHVAQILASS